MPLLLEVNKLLYLKDGYGVSLAFSGVQYPLSSLTFESISICEHVTFALPTLELRLKDVKSSLFEKYELGDGTTAELIIENNGIRDSMRFSVTGYLGEDAGRTIIISGILDYPKMLERSSIYINGTSSDAITAIGTDCGFKTIITTPTDDSQGWLPTLATGAQRCKEISSVSFRSTGVMLFGVTSLGELLYVDMNKTIMDNPFPVSTHPTPDKNFIVTSWFPRTYNGVLNHWGGYGFKVNTTGLDYAQNVITESPVTKRGLALNVSKSGGRIGFTNMDCGNTHNRYDQAFQSNKRNRALYSIDGVIVCSHILRDLNLLSAIDLTCDLRHTGRYLITGRTKFISGTSYYDKFELSSNSFNLNKQGRLT